MNGFEEFEFDLPSALESELINLLDGMTAAPLEQSSTATIPEVQGVYQLLRNDTLVYIGKTDADAGLKTRLSRHARKILHRPTFTGNVSFKAVRIMVFAALDLETQLIKHYRRFNSGAALWNGSGFGSNDPGRERETTNKPLKGFDTQYPISIDLPGNFLAPGTITVAEALAKLKAAVPYTIRYETLRSASGRALANQPHVDLQNAVVTIPTGPHTVRDLLKVVGVALGPSWQATSFESHIIVYREARKYSFGAVI